MSIDCRSYSYLLLPGCRAFRTFAIPLLLMAPAAAVRAQPDGTVHEYLNREQALKEVFPSSSTYRSEELALDGAAVEDAEQALHRKLDQTSVEVILCYDSDGVFLGYAVVSEESGKYRPITYMVGIDPEFHVTKVVVMVYREDRGGEIRTPRFLYQFKGKSAKDPIRVNRDIVNISGATISVRAISAGVKKVLYLVTDRYRSEPPPARPNPQPDSDSPK